MASLKEILAARPPRTIMVIRSDRVGDLILSTPFLTVLRRSYPQAAIVALVDPYCREVLQGSGLADLVESDLERCPKTPDLAIALAPRSQSHRTAYASGAPLRLGYAYRNRPLVRLAAHRFLTHCEVVTVKPPSQVCHEVEHLDRLARRMGLPGTLDWPLTVGLQAQKEPGRLVFHLGDRWLVNGWSFDDVRELLRRLRGFAEVLVSAGPREERLVRENGLDLEGVELHFGKSFTEWARLIGSAEVLVSPDTGAVHVAAAMGTPVLVAYEAATFEHCSRQWAPWKVPYRAVLKAGPKETTAAILAALEELISNSRNCASRAWPEEKSADRPGGPELEQ
jgi:ADP-heptose:LPS heptosyltransferase